MYAVNPKRAYNYLIYITYGSQIMDIYFLIEIHKYFWQENGNILIMYLSESVENIHDFPSS